MEQDFYYLTADNQRIGPVSWDELQRLHLPGNTYVWYKGLSTWVYLSTVQNLRRSNNGFFHHLTPLRIILLVYAVLGTVLMLLLGRFIFAFLSAHSYRHPDELPWFVLLFATALFVPFLFVKKRRYVVHALLLVLPLWIGSLSAGIYYRVMCDTYSYDLSGYCCIKKPFQGWGVMNEWGVECVPCIYESVVPDDFYYSQYCFIRLDGMVGTCDMEGTYWYPASGVMWYAIRLDGYGRCPVGTIPGDCWTTMA